MVALQQYITTHDGPLTSNTADLVGWEKVPKHYRANFSSETKTQLDSLPADWPETEFLATNGFVGSVENLVLAQPLNGLQYATLVGGLVAPVSRGNVTIRSASTRDPPVINPNWLTAKADEEVAVATFKRLRDIWNTKELQSVVVGKEYFPGQKVKTDKQILEFIRNSLSTIHHPASTCKMGKKDDKLAVVDASARVYGVTGLRVGDASAFPLLPPGHPQSTVYALAEKIAHSIIHA